MEDKQAQAGTTLHLTRTLPFPRERVFRAWTEIGELSKWWGPEGFTLPEAEVDLRVGGRYRLGMKPPEGEVVYLTGTYLEIEPPEKLVYTWQWESGPSEETLVTVEFRARGDHTDVVIRHERFPDLEARDRHAEGWGACLDRLERLA